jgi:predicted anti-sigma-YlaC factor YlaD
MRCDRSRELISALLDGEGAGALDDLGAHLDACAACRSWATQARALHRSLRLQPAPEVPDLTAAIVSRGAAEEDHRAPARRPTVLHVLRAALAGIAVTQLVVAAPELLARAAEHGHATRHLGGWDVAFAVGLLVVAIQPWRARGLLPMAGAVAGVMVLTGGIDFVSGGTPGMAEATHLLEVCGMTVLWAISRADTRRRHGGDGDSARWRWTRGRRSPTGWVSTLGWTRSGAGPVPQMSAMPSCVDVSPAASSRMMPSRARATRERTVPMGQSQTSAVSA